MYESGNEFQLIISDYYCPYKIGGLCGHKENVDSEFMKPLLWCDENICPMALKNHTKRCPQCNAQIPATFECGCGWRYDMIERDKSEEGGD